MCAYFAARLIDYRLVREVKRITLCFKHYRRYPTCLLASWSAVKRVQRRESEFITVGTTSCPLTYIPGIPRGNSANINQLKIRNIKITNTSITISRPVVRSIYLHYGKWWLNYSHSKLPWKNNIANYLNHILSCRRPCQAGGRTWTPRLCLGKELET